MLGEALQVLGPVVAVFGLMATGAVLRRLEWLTAEADRSLLLVTIRVLVPCLTFDVIIGNDRLRDPMNVWLPPALGFASVLIGIGLSWLFASALGWMNGLRTPVERRTFAFCAGIQNYGYIPLPLAAVLFDEATVGVVFVFMVGVDVALWTFGIAVLAGSGGTGGWRRAVSAPSVAIVLAVLLNLVDWDGVFTGEIEHLTDGVAQGVHMLGVCAIPLALLLIGATVADQYRALDPRQAMPTIAAGIVARNMLLPPAILAMLLLPGLSVELRRVIVLEAAMPCAVMPIVLARHYGGDPATALRVVLGTSFAGLVTIPIWLTIGWALLG